MTTLLPPNSTLLERSLVEATNYPLDATIIRGIKFEPPDAMLPWLIWEYGLEPLLPWIADRRMAIRQGLLWQRMRGTAASMKLAYQWVGFDDVILEEEPAGMHYGEFQVGVNEAITAEQVEALLALSALSAPLRSRLKRIYNTSYDIRRFILDQSSWGDLLSGYSGITQDGVVLSFGRKESYHTHYIANAPTLTHHRIHSIEIVGLHDYRYDHWQWGEQGLPIISRVGRMSRYIYRNEIAVPYVPIDIAPYLSIACAQILLSESYLGDENSCFPAHYMREVGGAFQLGEDALSEHYWGFEAVAITKRFLRYHALAIESHYNNQEITLYRNRMHHYAIAAIATITAHPSHLTHRYVLAHYSGVVSWLGSPHVAYPWDAIPPISSINHIRITRS